MENAPLDLGAAPSLKQQVYDRLRLRIISGELAPGEKLYEEELSRELGISRAPLREALNMLERDGFARIIPRKGAVVTCVRPEDIAALWKVRALLEPSAAAMALPNIPCDALCRVRARLEHARECPDDFEGYLESDLALHSLFIDYLENRYLGEILKKLKDHSLRMRWNAERQNGSTDTQIVLEATREHLGIAGAVAGGDGEALSAAVLRHIQESEKRTSRRFSSAGI